MREPKPSWQDVPAAMREKLAALVGEEIAGGEIAWGGYGPSATFVLTIASGRRVFCKGTHPGQTEVGHKALIRERRRYERLPELARFGPAYLGGADHESWHMALLEYIPRGEAVPPWSPDATRKILQLLVRFHASAPEHAMQELRPLAQSALAAIDRGWKTLRDDMPSRERFVALFADERAADLWLGRHIERLAAFEAQSATADGPQSWLHMDIRSDNLVFAADGRLVLVDWPALCFGPIIFDLAAFLPSLEAEGGPACADMLRRYEQLSGCNFELSDVAMAVAYISGYFASRAGEPAIAALPRLRWIQKRQLAPVLHWLSQSLAIAMPPALRAIEP